MVNRDDWTDQDWRDLAVYGPCPMCARLRRPHLWDDGTGNMIMEMRCDVDHSDGVISLEGMRYW